jgi:hypothetical protein
MLRRQSSSLGAAKSGERGPNPLPGVEKPPRSSVLEAERPLPGSFDGDHEADAVGTAASERPARLLDRDRIHVPAALVVMDLDHPSLAEAIRFGLAESVTDIPARGSWRMSFAFQIASDVHTRGYAPSSPTQTTQFRGDPSARSVERCT